jgi:hypothetical protein
MVDRTERFDVARVPYDHERGLGLDGAQASSGD